MDADLQDSPDEIPELYRMITEEGYDIVCASISSAAYLTANTLTEIVGAKADVKVGEANFRFILRDKLEEAQSHLKGLRLHLESLAGDYDEYITCKTETV